MKIIREKNVVNTYNVFYFNCNLKIYKTNLLPVQNLGEAFASCLIAGYGSAKSTVYLEALKQEKVLCTNTQRTTQKDLTLHQGPAVSIDSVWSTNINATDFKFVNL